MTTERKQRTIPPRVNPRKVREGIVISDKMDSTLVVAVNERVSHPRYGKTVQRTKKLYVHDEKNEAKIGDKVRVQETRPLSEVLQALAPHLKLWSVLDDSTRRAVSRWPTTVEPRKCSVSVCSAAHVDATPRSATSSSRP